MKKIYYFIIALFLLSATTISAQNNSRTYLTYAVGFGTGDLGEFISTPSWRGASLDFLHMINPNVALGGSVAWNVFYEEKDYDTYTDGTASLSGKQYRYSNNLPLLVNFNYYLNPDAKVIPFVGLGTGAMYTRRNTDMNIYTIEQDAWGFTLAPQVGIELNQDFGSAFTVMVKYYNGFKAGDFDKGQSYITLNVGWVFKS